MAPQKRSPQTTSLSDLVEWVNAIQADQQQRQQQNKDKSHALLQVSDDAWYGLQAIHTAVVCEIMRQAIETQEQEEDSDQKDDENRSRGPKKRKFQEILTDTVGGLGLGGQAWEEAWALCQAKGSAGDSCARTKKRARRKRNTKHAQEDLVLEQERMLQQSRERALEQQKEKSK